MTRIETYADAMAWLFARNQFSIKLGLEGPRRLLQSLGNPEAGQTFLHVAGTNGKGSVCATLAGLLAATGFRRVGLYTSPHLVSFRERVRVDGIPVSPAWVTRWLRSSLPVLEELNPTYFECVTALALDWFRERQCDAVVLETGLGGRLDATNVVLPKVTVITSISLDHTQILGDTLEAIWGEKLGVVKPGIPLIIDEARPGLAKLAEHKARELGSPLFNLADRWDAGPEGFRLRGQFGNYALPSDLRYESHQIRNSALALLGFEAFLNHKLPPPPIWLPALRTARLPGRTQWIQGAGWLPVLLDGAHNPDGVETLCRHVGGLQRGRPRIFFAAMRDKDAPAMVRTLRLISDDLIFLDLSAQFPRALKMAELTALLPATEMAYIREAKLEWPSLQPFLSLEQSSSSASSANSGAHPSFAVFCGSLYLLGEVIPLLLPHYQGLEEFGRLLEEDQG